MLHFAHRWDHSIHEISTVLSLAVVASVIATIAIAGSIKLRRDPSIRAHAGSLRQRDKDQLAQQRDSRRIRLISSAAGRNRLEILHGAIS